MRTIVMVAAAVVLGSSPAAAQSFREFLLPAGNTTLYAITLGPDGAMWFLDSYSGLDSHDRVWRITHDGTLKDFAVGRERGLFDITTGRDGRLWFTEYAAGAIGQLTTDGVFTERKLPPDRRPYAIDTAKDGGIWFSDAANRIGRLGPDGKLTEISSDSRPFDIATAPSGELWFTERLTDRVVRLSSTGLMTPFRTAQNAQLHGICAASGGVVWFPTNVPGWPSKMVRLTDDGPIEFTVTPPPKPGAALNTLIGACLAGPEGGIWFTMIVSQSGTANRLDNFLGRISDSGAVTLFSLETLHRDIYLSGIAVGLNKTIWLTDNIGRSVIRFRIPDSLFPAEFPEIQSFTPSAGLVGDVVRIDGRYLEPATAVEFNGTEAEFSTTPTGVLALVPAGAGTGLIAVKTPQGKALSATPFQVVRPIRRRAARH